MPDVPDLNIQIQHSLRHAIGDFHSVSHGFKTAPACRANVDRLLLNLDIKTSGYKHVLPVRLTFALREQR